MMKNNINTFIPDDAWNALSIAEKAEMMKVAIRNGITNLKEIRQRYNEFAKGGPVNDDDLVDWIIREEGFISKPEDIGDGKMTLGSGLTAQKWHDLYKQRGNKWSKEDNRKAVAEEVANRRRWAERTIPNWDSLPTSSQKALLSYKYNYDFTPTNSPKLFKALSDSDLFEAARQIDATSKNPIFKKGLQDRRLREQRWFLSDVGLPKIEREYTHYEVPVSTDVYNPYVTKIENTKDIPLMEPDISRYVTTRQVTPSEQSARKAIDTFERLRNFNRIMELTSPMKNPLADYPFPFRF